MNYDERDSDKGKPEGGDYSILIIEIFRMEKIGANGAKKREVMIKGRTEESFVELKHLRVNWAN